MLFLEKGDGSNYAAKDFYIKSKRHHDLKDETPLTQLDQRKRWMRGNNNGIFNFDGQWPPFFDKTAFDSKPPLEMRTNKITEES
jgi:hypothetical protein